MTRVDCIRTAESGSRKTAEVGAKGVTIKAKDMIRINSPDGGG